MDISNFKENYHRLIEYLNKSGYSVGYVRRFKVVIEHILKHASSDDIQCYTDIYREYEKSETYKWKLKEMRSIIRAVESFDLHGKYPDGTHNKFIIPRGAYQHLNAEYKALIDYYVDTEQIRGIKERTIASNKAVVTVLLLKLQKLGVEHLGNASEENILSLFVTPEMQCSNKYTCMFRFAAVLKACVSAFPSCSNVLPFLPAFKQKRRNIQYLTPEEHKKVKKILKNGIEHLTLRDKAMGILALYTGLRSCDIAGLKFSSIDLEQDVLNIKQQKTGVLLTLPLSATVGNAIYDYVEFERPDTESEYVFISEKRPFGRIQGGSSMSAVAARIMKAANIRQSSDDRKGMHIFRHRVATTLLENGVPRPVISSIVGQTSPKSLDTYLSTDFTHLRECAISIESYPIPKEVFGI